MDIFGPHPSFNCGKVFVVVSCRLLLFTIMVAVIVVAPFLILSLTTIRYAMVSFCQLLAIVAQRQSLGTAYVVLTAVAWFCFYLKVCELWQYWFGGVSGRFTCRFCASQHNDVCSRCGVAALGGINQLGAPSAPYFLGWTIVPEH
jgi:hypothetical protein